jgi:hypothetical protein
MARTSNRQKTKTEMRARTRARAATATKTAPAAATATATAGGNRQLAPVAVSPCQRVQQNAINNAELRANAQTILSVIHESRPKNTNSVYIPKQKEFEEFCCRKQYYDGATVTEEKLLLFLVEEVANRPLKVKSRKAAIDTPQEETRLAWRSVRTYITAMTDLYRTQRALGMNTHPSPREDNVREYLKSLQRRDTQRDKDNYADKGRDTLLDGYSESEFERVCHELWAHSSTSTECHFRTLVDLLFGHYLLTRGGDRRAAEISDLFTFEFAGEGSTRCMPLIFTTRAGKQNQHGRLETAGAYRNRKPLICLLGGLAFYLLYRWDLGGEPFPDFSRRSTWYDIRLIKGNGTERTTAFSYNSQREWVVKAFAYAGITSQKKTHVGRSSGARTAELKGISEDQIRRAGRWNQEQMVGCYLNSLPRKFMRTMAGHPPQIGCFEIRRAGVTPPDVLLSMIWPELDRWKGCFGPGTDQVNDLAAMGSTNLLFYLREVILQDSVVLMKQYPDSPIWNHPVFRHPAYTSFAQQLSDFILEEERPSQLAVLIQAMPVLADYLKSIDARNEARTIELKTELTEQLRATEERLVIAQSSLLSTGLNFQMIATATAPAPAPPPWPAPAPPSSLSQPPPTAVAAAVAVAVANVVEREEGEGGEGGGRGGESQYISAQSSVNGSRATSPIAIDTITRQPPPQYRMCRAVKTVEALWREWTVGLRGGPAVAELDSRWGSRWRAGRQSELQWYSLRFEVIKEIRRVAKARRSSEEAAMHIVNLQQQQTGYSIDQFCKRLRANRKS